VNSCPQRTKVFIAIPARKFRSCTPREPFGTAHLLTLAERMVTGTLDFSPA
jgi:hypothetical protein